MTKQSIRETNHNLRRDETVPNRPRKDRSPDDFPEVERGSDHMPAAGPHASDQLTDYDKTPGSGALTERRVDGDADASTG
jgi:hypothetical protein